MICFLDGKIKGRRVARHPFSAYLNALMTVSFADIEHKTEYNLFFKDVSSADALEKGGIAAMHPFQLRF